MLVVFTSPNNPDFKYEKEYDNVMHLLEMIKLKTNFSLFEGNDVLLHGRLTEHYYSIEDGIEQLEIVITP